MLINLVFKILGFFSHYNKDLNYLKICVNMKKMSQEVSLFHPFYFIVIKEEHPPRKTSPSGDDHKTTVTYTT